LEEKEQVNLTKTTTATTTKTKDHDISEELEKKIGSITLSFSQNFIINKLKNLARKNPDNANTTITYYY
jgi:hypothetical protein